MQMRDITRATARLCDVLRKASMGLLVVIGTVMSIVVMLQIIFRFLIKIPFPWSEELARYLMIWMGMLGAFVALREERHIGVSLLVEKLPEAVGSKVMVMVQVATMAFLVIVARYGFSLAMFNSTQLSPAMQVSMALPYMAIPVGSSLMTLELLAGVLQELFPVEKARKRRLTAATLDG